MKPMKSASNNANAECLLRELRASKHGAQLQPEDRADICQRVLEVLLRSYGGKPLDELKRIGFGIQRRMIRRLRLEKARSDERLKRLSVRIRDSVELDDPVVLAEWRDEFRRALVECLSPRERALILTVYLHSNSVRGAAERLEKPESTLRNALRPTLKKLHDRLTLYPDLSGALLAGELKHLESATGEECPGTEGDDEPE